MVFFKNILNKLGIKSAAEAVSGATESGTAIREEKLITIDDLEEELLRSDLGVTLSLDFIEALRSKINDEEIKISFVEEQLKNFLLVAFNNKFKQDNPYQLKLNTNGLSIVLVVGVNGVGKTTSIAKLAARLKNQGKKVLLAAGDTFRAAAEEQLRTWSERAEVGIVEMEHGTKSSAVVYKAIEKAKEENFDVLLIDTAGRLQNKSNLMEELGKIKQVIEKNAGEEAFAESLIVLDATTGQNALEQAKHFNEAANLTGIILTKYDGSAKAGMVFSLAHDLALPVKLVGTGEKLEDIQDFDFDTFIAKYF